MTRTTRFVVPQALLLMLAVSPAWSQEKEGGSALHRRALEQIMKSRNEELAKREAAEKEAAPTAKPQPASPSEKPRSGLPSFSEVAPKPKPPEPKVDEKPRTPPERETRVIEVKREEPVLRPRPTPPIRVPATPHPASVASVRDPQSDSYAVQSGDTFSSIALKLYGEEGKWTAIAKANPLVDPIRLKVGQVLKLPDLNAQQQERSREFDRIRGEVAGRGATPQTVTVEPGDSLGVIAQRVYGKASLWKALFEANKDQLQTPDELKVGMKLKVPPRPGSSAPSATTPQETPNTPSAPAPAETEEPVETRGLPPIAEPAPE